MEYITYKRFKTRAICGDVNIPFGTILHEQDGMLYWNGNPVCSATSENGWNYFRPNTLEGMHRWELLEKLYKWYEKNGCADDFADERWPNQENGYWKNRLRTASTERLEQIYAEKFAVVVC
jgi:hypothetical protein|nr:MAG TPA: hypothetical protein [Caudoviricetes sp.]